MRTHIFTMGFWNGQTKCPALNLNWGKHSLDRQMDSKSIDTSVYYCDIYLESLY